MKAVLWSHREVRESVAAAAVLCFLRQARFADVEQGILVRNESALHARPLPLLVATQ